MASFDKVVRSGEGTALDFSRCDHGGLDDATLMPLLHDRVASLSVRDCRKLTDAALLAAAERCGASLTALDANGCKNLTDAALAAIARRCGGLRRLDVGGCKNLTDAALVALVEQRCAASLTSLDVGGCRRLTDASVAALLARCDGLTLLNLRGCKNLTERCKARRRPMGQRYVAHRVASGVWPLLETNETKRNRRALLLLQGAPTEEWWRHQECRP